MGRNMEQGQRRSHRILLSIPLVLRGMDEDGTPFEAAGRTVALNQHGARIQVKHRLRPGQVIGVTNHSSGAEADFRVVGPLAPPTNQMGEWGIECLLSNENIWKIYFPPPDEKSDAHILLECRHCHALTLQLLSLVEVEVLETAGLLSKSCVPCGKPTPWGYPPHTYESGTHPDAKGAGVVNGGASGWVINRRKRFRKQAQIPVRVRDYFGEIEMAQTENISLDGFCFSAFREYYVGQGIVVTCPFDANMQKPEAMARIVRIGPESRPERYIYGVRYDQASQ
jgi:hypothetical protein